MHHIRCGSGKPLLLIHGLGGNWQSWNPILDDLVAQREVIAVDLPGFGQSPRLAGETSIRTLADEVTAFLDTHGLTGIDAVGSSMGARLVLELARRGGIVGGVVSLDPGGFWQGWERHAFFSSIYLSVRLLRLLRPVLPSICASPVGRALLLAQFSARPTKLAPAMVSDELCSYVASPAFDELLYQLAYGDEQQGAPRNTIAHPLVIGWGRRDRVCLPRQARAGPVPGCAIALVRALRPFSALGCTCGDHAAHPERACRRAPACRCRTRQPERRYQPRTFYRPATAAIHGPGVVIRFVQGWLTSTEIAIPARRVRCRGERRAVGGCLRRRGRLSDSLATNRDITAHPGSPPSTRPAAGCPRPPLHPSCPAAGTPCRCAGSWPARPRCGGRNPSTAR
jgi:pimeloyl-ACP methyl ester carboxylesterase